MIISSYFLQAWSDALRQVDKSYRHTRAYEPSGRRLTMAKIRLRIILENGPLGPGKVDLMEQIDQLGSISAAGHALGMSYRRAWCLVEESNTLFERPLVEKRHGGKAGGGATLTALGRSVVARYRDLEQTTAEAAQSHIKALHAEIDVSHD